MAVFFQDYKASGVNIFPSHKQKMRKYTTRLVLFLVLLSITCSCILAAVSLQCSASGDPHFNTFQSFAYEMFNVQESVIVKSNKFSAMLRTLKTSYVNG